jgi:hypothetical protein
MPRLYRLAPLPQVFHHAAVGCSIRAPFGNASGYGVFFAEYTHMLHIVCHRSKLAILEWRILCHREIKCFLYWLLMHYPIAICIIF